jgi:hypothetical protein
MSTPTSLLERYVEAKDLVRPHLMREIYAPDAVLTFSLATDSVAFPARVAGLDGITRTLVSDFALKYTRCKTFYVCESPPPAAGNVAILPWLVLMRETAAPLLRVGKGYYKWAFERPEGAGMRVAAMHIHIQRMDPIADAGDGVLETAQSVLRYPWLTPALLLAEFERLIQAAPRFAFLEAFKQPLALG